jgi:DNA-binding response OmpR family regulator
MPTRTSEKYNLSGAAVLIVDTNPHTCKILVQIMLGFGSRTPAIADSFEGAMQDVRSTDFDLILVRARLGEEDGYDFVEWLRRSHIEPNCYTAIILLSAHTPVSKVEKARDSGANFIVSVPFAPVLLLERIIWIANQPRLALQTAGYFGPDCRFHSIALKPPSTGKRSNDNASDDPSDPDTG